MSSALRERTSEIIEAGKAERGNFEPTGVPLAMYNYWLGHSFTDRANRIRLGIRRENFCHFWRVVAIWAPLMFLVVRPTAITADALARFFSTRLGQAVAIVLYGVLFSLMGLIGGLALVSFVALTLPVVALGLVLGILLDKAVPQTTQGKVLYGGAMLLTLPASAPTYGVIKFYRWWPREWTAPFWRGVWFAIAGALGLVAAVIAVGGFIAGTMQYGWWFVPALAGGIAAFIGVGMVLISGMMWLGEFIQGKRRVAVRQRESARAEAIAEGTYVAPSVRFKQSLFARFFRGLGDLIVFGTQVARVKKWGVCPLVEIEHDNVGVG